MAWENFFSAKSHWFADRETLDRRAMRIWVMRNASAIVAHMGKFTEDAKLPVQEDFEDDPPLNVVSIHGEGRSTQEEAISASLLQLPPGLQPPPCYKAVTGSISGTPEIWGIPPYNRHTFFSDITGQNIVDLCVAGFITGTMRFGPGDRWKLLESMAEDLVINCGSNGTDVFALMGPRDQIASRLGLSFDRNTS